MNASLVYPKQNSYPRFPFPLLIVIGILIVFAVGLAPHAMLHSAAPTIAGRCDLNGADIILKKDANGHCASLVKLSENQYGRWIVDDKGDNLTAFANSDERMNTLQKAIENLYRAGYRRIEFIRPELIEKVTNVLLQMK